MFYDRKEAGKFLAQKIRPKIKTKFLKDYIIVALPRGGVMVAKEVSDILHIKMNIIVTRKIGYPENPEYAIGAVGESGKIVLGEEGAEVSEKYLNEKIAEEKKEIKRRLKEYRGGRNSPKLTGKRIILIDDGVATGLTISAAISEIKQKRPYQIILAFPVAPYDKILELQKELNEIIVVEKPKFMGAISEFYLNFEQVTDQEVKKALRDS